MAFLDRVSQLERENTALKEKLAREEKVKVTLKAHGGFVRHMEMRAQDIRPEILIPDYGAFNAHVASESCQNYLEQQLKVRRFILDNYSGTGFPKTFIYREE